MMMMSAVFTVRIDDDDRDECPDTPFTAVIYIQDDVLLSGFGSTPGRALADALSADVGLADALADAMMGEGVE